LFFAEVASIRTWCWDKQAIPPFYIDPFATWRSAIDPTYTPMMDGRRIHALLDKQELLSRRAFFRLTWRRAAGLAWKHREPILQGLWKSYFGVFRYNPIFNAFGML
jgi:hypothetical protein